MTNYELLTKISQELNSRYQIGLHNLTRESYIFKSKLNKERYCMNPELVTEDDIISSILSKGLYVPEKCIGLDSTVRFQDNITEDSFNYFYGDSADKKYIVVVIIPNYIYLHGKEYFLGDLREPVNLVNYALFHTLLPREFIYGYYVRNVTLKEDTKRDYHYYDDYIFDEQFEFYSNERFYGYMSKEEQQQFWIDYFNNNDVNISILNAVNYPNLFNTLFQNSRNRYAIKETRKQLLKSRKISR